MPFLLLHQGATQPTEDGPFDIICAASSYVGIEVLPNSLSLSAVSSSVASILFSDVNYLDIDCASKSILLALFVEEDRLDIDAESVSDAVFRFFAVSSSDFSISSAARQRSHLEIVSEDISDFSSFGTDDRRINYFDFII